jgi:inositol phosphorylceramide mannosyltransferase catalytic subunit
MIPRVFHQIWINRADPELPEKFRAYRDSWLQLHPGWEYKLWNLDNLDFLPQRMDLVKSAPNYAQMADVLRYEILHRHGGIYMDTDFECLRSIEPILEGVQNFACSEDGRSISNGFIGASPGSVYMQRCIAALPEKVGLAPPSQETGPGLLTRTLLGGGLAGDFTLFPRAWFYPYNWNELDRAGEDFPDAYAIHRWAHSWGESERNLLTRVQRKIHRLFRP